MMFAVVVIVLDNPVQNGIKILTIDVVETMSFFHTYSAHYTNILALDDILCFILRPRTQEFIDTLGVTRISYGVM